MTEAEVRAVVAEVAELDAAEIELDVPLATAGIDSLLAMEIAVEIERRCGVRFTEAELQGIGTFADLVRLARAAAAGERASSSVR